MEVSGKTKMLAVIGKPIEHSFSPMMHNGAIQALNLDYHYVAFSVESQDLEEAIKGLWVLGVQGVNITVPHKEKVISFLEEITPQARLIGAVNTLIRGNKGFIGENTDGKGLLMALERERKWVPRGKKVVILGAGGSARAVGVNCGLEGAEEVVFVNRTLEKGNAIVQILKKNTETKAKAVGWEDPSLEKIINDAQIIINTTTLGLEPNKEDMPPLDMTSLKRGCLVVDLIYNPLETRLLREAKSRGCETYNGLGMLAFQGALSFGLWTGLEPPFEIMLKILKEVKR